MLSMTGALSLRLSREHPSPIVTRYDLATALLYLYDTGKYDGQVVDRLRMVRPAPHDLYLQQAELWRAGILQTRSDLPTAVSVLSASPHKEVSDFVCGLDPFAYISHLSAMEYHGLTDRLSNTLSITTLPAPQWRQAAQDKMERQLGAEGLQHYLRLDFPPITKFTVAKIGKTTIHVHVSKHATSYISPKNRLIRVASIGRTFLDMLRQPGLCAGMNHVIDTYANHASQYLPLIANELNRWGTPIEKVRAGYILEEHAHIMGDARIQDWAKLAQRGGSRKLDPAAEYESRFSEKWCLSINAGQE